MHSTLTKILCIILCTVLCNGCFYWKKNHNGNHDISLDPSHPAVIIPAGIVYELTPEPFDMLLSMGVYASVGLVALPVSFVTLPVRYPFFEREDKENDFDDSLLELDLPSSEEDDNLEHPYHKEGNTNEKNDSMQSPSLQQEE